MTRKAGAGLAAFVFGDLDRRIARRGGLIFALGDEFSDPQFVFDVGLENAVELGVAGTIFVRTGPIAEGFEMEPPGMQAFAD